MPKLQRLPGWFVRYRGTIAAQTPAATAQFAGVMQPEGVLAAELAAAMFSGGGTAHPGGPMVLALQNAVAHFTGVMVPEGTFTVELATAVFAGTGLIPTEGTLSAEVQAAIAFLTGGQSAEGQLGAVIPAATMSMSGQHQMPGVIATANASMDAGGTRTPAITFTGYTPLKDDLIVVFCTTQTTATIEGITGIAKWYNALGAANVGGAQLDVEPSDGTVEICCVYHYVTPAEETAGTTTYTLTNLYDTIEAINVVAAILRGAGPTKAYGIDAIGTIADAADAATPHILPGLAGAELADNSIALSAIGRDGTTDYSTAPSGWARIATSGVIFSGTSLFQRDALTVEGSTIANTNITPPSGSEYAAISVALNRLDAIDNFVRANNSGGAGADWTNRHGVLGILNNAGAPYTANTYNTGTHNTVMTGNDMEVSIILGAEAGSSLGAWVVIGANSSGEAVWAWLDETGVARIYSKTTGGWDFNNGAVQRNTAVVNVFTGTKFACRRVGNVYTCLLNDAPISGSSWTDSGNIIARDANHRIVGAGSHLNVTGTVYRLVDSFAAKTL